MKLLKMFFILLFTSVCIWCSIISDSVSKKKSLEVDIINQISTCRNVFEDTWEIVAGTAKINPCYKDSFIIIYPIIIVHAKEKKSEIRLLKWIKSKNSKFNKYRMKYIMQDIDAKGMELRNQYGILLKLFAEANLRTN